MVDTIDNETLNGPALKPPPGVEPDLTTKPPLNNVAYMTAGLCLGVVTLLVAGRIVAQSLTWKRPHPIDVLTAICYILYVVYIWALIELIKGDKLFIHQWNVRLKDMIKFTYPSFRGINIWIILTGLLKATILWEIIRILVPHGTQNRGLYWTCHVLAVFILAFYAALFISFHFTCTPWRGIWDPLVPGDCPVDDKASGLAAATLNLVWDLVVLIVPQRVIWKLHLKMRKKIHISLIFGFGFVACTAAAFRLSSTIQSFQTDDSTFADSANILWATAELACGFVVLCAPSLQKALHVIGTKVTGFSSTTDKMSNHQLQDAPGVFPSSATCHHHHNNYHGPLSMAPHSQGRPYRRLSDEIAALGVATASDEHLNRPKPSDAGSSEGGVEGGVHGGDGTWFKDDLESSRFEGGQRA